MEKFFSKHHEEVLKNFNVSKSGLSENQVKENLDKFGYNQLTEKQKQTILQVFLSQFKDLLVIILIIAAIISAATGNLESTLVIFAVIILNSILGTVQHFKAEASLDSLKALSSPSAKVYRNGKKVEVQSKEIVPGDILILEAGDMVAADGRIIENFSLQVNESSLTGESESVNKFIDIIEKEEIALGDQKNMVFSGSLVTYGRALVVVTATGMNTEIGKIAHLMEETQEKQTPLQASLDDFSKKLAIGILVICVLIFGLSLYRGTPMLDSLMFAVALAVAAIPEALSSIVTIVLALGTQKMAKENAIIKKLRAVEGLGSVSVICSDKTGTLTQNKMTVKKVYLDNKLIDGEDLDLNDELTNYLVNSSILCNDSTSKDGVEIGDPTEVALVNLGHKLSLDEIEIRKSHGRLAELPFDSDRKLMSTLHKFDNKNLMFTKGAFDVLLDRIVKIKTSEGVRDITYEDKQNIINANKQLSQSGLRVLAFAYKEFANPDYLSLEDENNYTFMGLISMIDPPRVESAEAVRDCITAGIKPVMITGDHKITASAIAKQIGILRDDDRAIEGLELDKMSDEELKNNIEHISVYARVSPEHKIRIVKAWQEKNEIVAMTGDGVNDAPALKQADIGIAMGITGTEVSKDAASVILTDDNFATIVKSVANGRNIYKNIKNSIKFLLSGNTSGILSVLYTSLMALPMPFHAVHLLFINLLTDSLPAIAIGMEKSKKDLLKDKPRARNSSILSKDFIYEVAAEGFVIAVFTLIAFYIGLKTDSNVASTMAFATLCLARLFHGFNCRGDRSIFSIGLFSNRYSWAAFGVGLLFLNSVLFVPFLQNLFEVSDLSGSQVGYIYLLAFIPTLIIQVVKVIRDAINDRKHTNVSSSEEKEEVGKVA
ncbi:cation-translocating P-type ATPase [Clostridium tertium]|uniref:cation-translocating P-type ATPase n=1 Tax=Clostridium TaxID=1485 RepID=UPI000C08C1FB|nr:MULTISPECIES: cation-translocating P-type ATPase [Clostridium]MBU6134077.1 cation-translocating P-type ATPase [Clostridium tertium]MDB1955111.1 cation-translocating P-type ATPase [Clostridium tertium]MDB1958370.1 cation-translocating P-type ATPase [Clostridium tertium]MDB1963749.1 cation-translocating P-type ATPase [Clostridium tertium]MDB1965947.1 cation-translocating P-type ATPase [Clostridium tertium]